MMPNLQILPAQEEIAFNSNKIGKKIISFKFPARRCFGCGCCYCLKADDLLYETTGQP